MLASPESKEYVYTKCTHTTTQNSLVYMSLSLSGPSMLPNNPVSIVLSILYRNYYKNLPPYNRMTEPMAQAGTFPNRKRDVTTFSMSLQACLHPSNNFLFSF